MAGNVYRFDPPPVQRAPYAPIPAQGNQPPRCTCAAMMACVLASWPTGLEHQPKQRPLTVAPLTLTYGSQPPKVPLPGGNAQLLVLARAWDPPAPAPTQRPLTVAPLTLAYGSQPPSPVEDLTDLYTVLQTWPPAWYPAQRAPPVAGFVGAVVVPDQPTPSATTLTCILRPAWEPPVPAQPVRVLVAPLTLTYGNQPPPRVSPVTAGLIIDSWRPDAPLPARPTPLPQAPAVVPVTPPSTAALAVLLRSAWDPPAPPPVQRPLTSAPLALVYGNQPPPRASSATAALIIESWRQGQPLPVRPVPFLQSAAAAGTIIPLIVHHRKQQGIS